MCKDGSQFLFILSLGDTFLADYEVKSPKEATSPDPIAMEHFIQRKSKLRKTVEASKRMTHTYTSPLILSAFPEGMRDCRIARGSHS